MLADGNQVEQYDADAQRFVLRHALPPSLIGRVLTMPCCGAQSASHPENIDRTCVFSTEAGPT
jgi:hypothetical protein